MRVNILIAASGTGGHIYPALAIAKAMKEQDDRLSIHFVGTPRGLENQLIPKANFPLHQISVGRLNSNVSIWERLQTLILMPWAFVQSSYLILRLRPRLVLGVGGHASGPLLLMASLFRQRTFIWEPNAFPGLANRLLSRFVDECLVVFDSAKGHLSGKSIHEMGFPLRRDFEQKQERAVKPVTADELFRVFVFGGSQGARGLNTVVAESIQAGEDWLKGVEFIHQTGASDYSRICNIYGPDHGHVKILDYIDDMKKCYDWADLVICRSGTGTLSELAALGKAAFLVPFPFSSDGHQEKNAKALAEKGAAQWAPQSAFTPQFFKNLISKLKTQGPTLAELGKNIRSFHHPEAARDLAVHMLLKSRIK